MKIKRNKQANKMVKILTKQMDYRLPLQIIADGNFINASVKNDLCKEFKPQTGFERSGKVYSVKGSDRQSNERPDNYQLDPLTRAISTYLKCSVSVFTTISVMNELSMLGHTVKQATQLARSFKLFPTEYSKLEKEKLPPAKLCITKMINRAKEEHFIIATNDPALKHKCRVNKVPYLYIYGNRLNLEGIKKYENYNSSNKKEIDGELQILRDMKKEKGIIGNKGKKKFGRNTSNKVKGKKGVNPLANKKSSKAVEKKREKIRHAKSKKSE